MPRRRTVSLPKGPPTALLQHAAPPIPQPGVWCHEHGVWECTMITGIDTENPENHNPKSCHSLPKAGLDVCGEHEGVDQPIRKGFFS